MRSQHTSTHEPLPLELTLLEQQSNGQVLSHCLLRLSAQRLIALRALAWPHAPQTSHRALDALMLRALALAFETAFQTEGLLCTIHQERLIGAAEPEFETLHAMCFEPLDPTHAKRCAQDAIAPFLHALGERSDDPLARAPRPAWRPAHLAIFLWRGPRKSAPQLSFYSPSALNLPLSHPLIQAGVAPEAWPPLLAGLALAGLDPEREALYPLDARLCLPPLALTFANQNWLIIELSRHNAPEGLAAELTEQARLAFNTHALGGAEPTATLAPKFNPRSGPAGFIEGLCEALDRQAERELLIQATLSTQAPDSSGSETGRL